MIDISTPIILIGFKHTGKTALGSALAKALKGSFMDLDEVIEQSYQNLNNERLNSRKIVQKHGIDYFRDLESALLEETLSLKPDVLALGGGTPLRKKNQALIRQGTVIWITGPKGSVFERIMTQGRPAFFPQDEDAFDAFNRIWAEREPIYASLAAHCVMNNGSILQGVQQVLNCIRAEVIL